MRIMGNIFRRFCIFSFLIFFLLLNITLKGQENNHPVSVAQGERLFFGLIKTGDAEPVNCASCHNVNEIDTFNWNPSAFEIALSTSSLDSSAYAAILLNPVSSKRIATAHKNMNLDGQQIKAIRLYLDHLNKKGFQPDKPDISRLLLFIVLVLVFLGALTDLVFIHFVKYKIIHTVIILGTGAWITKMIYDEAVLLGRSPNYMPLQPVKFSHWVHASSNQINCQYCHHSAEFSKSAGIPATGVCMNCHIIVREGTNSGKFEINKVIESYEQKKEIKWNRVYQLPDYVYFNHAQHVGAGKLDCAECHGDVKQNHFIIQANDLSMGWCLNCHTTRKVQFINNEYYQKTYEEIHNEIKNGQLDSVLVKRIGGMECMKCHY